MRKVTTRDFAFTRSPPLRVAHDRRLSPFRAWAVLFMDGWVESQRRAATARFRTIQIYPKDIGGRLWAHSVHQSAHALQIDALGPKGGRSRCTPIRQAPGGWQCRASASHK